MTVAMTSAVPFAATDVELIDSVTVDPVGASSATLSQATVEAIRANRKKLVVVRDTAGTSKYSRHMGLGQGNRGYAMAALLVGMSVMAVLMSAAMPVWSTFTKREKETELIWRGQQYARAVGLFQRKYANTFPPTVDILVEQRFLRKKYKDPITGEDFQLIPAGGGMPPGSIAAPGGAGSRQSVTPSIQQLSPTQTFQGRPNGVGQFGAGGAMPGQPPRPGQQSGPAQPAIGIQGVVSKSSDSALKIYNGRTKYNEWAFVY